MPAVYLCAPAGLVPAGPFFMPLTPTLFPPTFIDKLTGSHAGGGHGRPNTSQAETTVISRIGQVRLFAFSLLFPLEGVC